MQSDMDRRRRKIPPEEGLLEPKYVQGLHSTNTMSSLVILKMGIMMTETRSHRRLTINIRLAASCWFLSLSLSLSLSSSYVHNARSQEPKKNNERCLLIVPLSFPGLNLQHTDTNESVTNYNIHYYIIFSYLLKFLSYPPLYNPPPLLRPKFFHHAVRRHSQHKL